MLMNDFTILEKYIENDLGKDEQKKTEKLIFSNHDVANELQFRREVNEAMREKDIMDFREKLVSIHTNLQHSQTSKVRQLMVRKWHLVAASITILIMVGSFILSNTNNISTEKIYDAYYSLDEVSLTKRSIETQNSQFKIALDKFEAKEYNEVIKLLNAGIQNNIAQYYLGLAYMETAKFKSAAASFQQIINNQQNIFMEQAKWYKALCLLKLQDKKGATELFTSIRNDEDLYHEAADKILKKLK